MTDEATEFLRELQEKRDEAVKKQAMNEIEWLKVLQTQTQSALDSLQNSLETGIFPTPQQGGPSNLTGSCHGGPVSKTFSVPRKNMLKTSTTSALITAQPTSVSALPSYNDSLPPHLAFVHNFLDKYPKPHPLAHPQMNAQCNSVVSFLQGHHLMVLKRCEQFFGEISQLAKEVEEVYCDAVAFVLRFHVEVLERLSNIENPDQTVGFQGLLNNCVDAVQNLQLDISTVGSKQARVMGDIQTAAFLLDSPTLLKYQGR
eukprot:CAMPEP_0201528714 /NCGR_PEP_ID=MMETSP0161_2-20130828/39313_1 /ASSEMBLY_ACC=CAM_ASM_000251 /TAXON_ID=180227 /ORGANISM="Neoparamoeba aestuarina, Strain SoJaBio B1-5/56/2" /LENGTH=257 /DNA_ID=CAMNT_0047930141 /DNA_START=1277 /DNA_END=2050 /DNA_ORIENTATION=+